MIKWPEFIYIDHYELDRCVKQIKDKLCKWVNDRVKFYKSKYGYDISEADKKAVLDDYVEESINEYFNSCRPYTTFNIMDFCQKLSKSIWEKNRQINELWNQNAINNETTIHRQNRAISVLEGMSDRFDGINSSINEVNDTMQTIRKENAMGSASLFDRIVDDGKINKININIKGLKL